jgi:TetR/AcrR family transcriptional regulator, regulator of autoinduction and epiphytic fitness
MEAARAALARDGRNVRAERTRTAVVEALLELLDEGDVKPTSERIAERAGVAERTIFQHFHDREALFEAAARRQYERVVPTLKPISPELPLEERLDAFADQRAGLYELVSGVRRGALVLEHESPVVHERLQAVRRAKAKEAARVFAPELERLPARERKARSAALGAATAWTAWESLRFHQGLGVPAARDAMRAAVASLVSP